MNDFSKPSTSPDANDELNWLALQYVTGELSDAEQDEFEKRLLDNLAACEAVAAVSEICDQYPQAMQAADLQSETRVATPIASGSRLKSWVAVLSTMAAVMWLFVLLDGTKTDENDTLTRSQSETEDAAGLIAGWTESEQEVALDEDSLFNLNGLDLNDGSDPDIPAWMIAAVSLENAEREMEDMMNEPVEMKEN